MLTTSRMSGIGIGSTSPKMPPCRTNSATLPALSRKWNGSWASASGVKPAAVKAAVQIGIWPPLRTTASVLSPIPTAAIWSPGTRQLPHSQTKISP